MTCFVTGIVTLLVTLFYLVFLEKKHVDTWFSIIFITGILLSISLI